jgi:hypothetical protein
MSDRILFDVVLVCTTSNYFNSRMVFDARVMAGRLGRTAGIEPYNFGISARGTVLRIERTLDGDEIDKIISDLQARKGLAIERVRRKRWKRVIENAADFEPA